MLNLFGLKFLFLFLDKHDQWFSIMNQIKFKSLERTFKVFYFNVGLQQTACFCLTSFTLQVTAAWYFLLWWGGGAENSSSRFLLGGLGGRGLLTGSTGRQVYDSSILNWRHMISSVWDTWLQVDQWVSLGNLAGTVWKEAVSSHWRWHLSLVKVYLKMKVAQIAELRDGEFLDCIARVAKASSTPGLFIYQLIHSFFDWLIQVLT